MEIKTECPQCTCVFEGVVCDACGYVLTQHFTPEQQVQAASELMVRLQHFADCAKKHRFLDFGYHDSDGFLWDSRPEYKGWKSFEDLWYEPDSFCRIPNEVLTVPLEGMEQWIKDEIQRRKEAREAELRRQEVEQVERQRLAEQQRIKAEYDIYLRIKAQEEGKGGE
jgi:hypothetical protein